MHGGGLQTFGLTLEAEKQEIQQKATEQEEEDVQEFQLGVVDNGGQHQVERHQQHDGRKAGGNLVSVRKILCLHSQVQEAAKGGSRGEPGEEA